MIDPITQKERFRNYLTTAAELAKGKSSWTSVGQWAGNYAAGYEDHRKLWEQLEKQAKEEIKKNLEDPSFTLKMVRDILKANERIKPFVEKWERARGIVLDEHINGVVESADMNLMKFKFLDLYPINENGTSFIPAEYLLNQEDKEAQYVAYNRVREISELSGKERLVSDLDTYNFIYVYRDRDGKLKVNFEYPQVLQPVLEIDKAPLFPKNRTGTTYSTPNTLNGMKVEFGFHGAEYSRGRTDMPSAFKVRKMCVNAELLAYLFKDYNATFEYKKTISTPEDLKAEVEKFDAYLKKIDTIRNAIQNTADKWNELAEQFQDLQDKLTSAINNIKDYTTASEKKIKKTIEILAAADFIDTFESDDSNY